MKTIKSLTWIIVLTALWLPLAAQTSITDIKGQIVPYPLSVSYNKTTNLVFPYSVKSVDRGSSGVIVQQVKGVENVLQLKASETGFSETNLTVITGDGALYSFLLTFEEEPELLNINVSEYVRPNRMRASFSEIEDNEALLKETAIMVSTKKKMAAFPKDERFDMGLKLLGIYIADDVLYFQLQLENETAIGYDVDQFRIYIRDKKKSKRTASQELELKPLHIEGNAQRVNGQSLQNIVVALEKFTIPDRKFLRVELVEKNGGRNLKLKLHNKHLIAAQKITN